MLPIRVTAGERDAIRADAHRENKKVSEYIRAAAGVAVRFAAVPVSAPRAPLLPQDRSGSGQPSPRRFTPPSMGWIVNAPLVGFITPHRTSASAPCIQGPCPPVPSCTES